MKEARKRNPHIVLDALEWGAPGWIGNGRFYSQDNADYIVRFLLGARKGYGLDIAYVGIWNEKPYDPEWIKRLRKTLDAAGLRDVKIVAADQVNTWNIVDSIAKDPDLKNVVARIGVHYPGSQSTPAARECGIPLWSSEDGPWNGTWSGAQRIAKTLNRNYIEGKMTETTFWSVVTSYYDNLPLPGSGLMRANTPWSGHYEVQPAVWAVAHTTQFTEPGWTYLDGEGCGILAGGGSYVTLKSPDGKDFSVIIETMDAKAPQSMNFVLSGGLEAASLHSWRTSKSRWLEKLSDVRVSDGHALLTLDPACLYTLTTTRGQQKADVSPPPTKAFPLPYREDFESYPIGATARYITDWAGVWDVAGRTDGKGKCLVQASPSRGILWCGMGDPRALVGGLSWSDYSVSIDARPTPAGLVMILGRVGQAPENENPPQGYSLEVGPGGAWALRTEKTVLTTGKVSWYPGLWHNLKLKFDSDHILVSIDGAAVADATDDRFSAGMVGFGGSWGPVQFDNLRVDPGDNPLRKNLALEGTARASSVWDEGYPASAANDGDSGTRWNSIDAPGAGQWLEIDFKQPKSFDAVSLQQFDDRITGYKIQVQAGSGWADVAAGERLGAHKVIRFPRTTSRAIRLLATAATQSISIYEMEIYDTSTPNG
jgi:galactosylceramidase